MNDNNKTPELGGDGKTQIDLMNVKLFSYDDVSTLLYKAGVLMDEHADKDGRVPLDLLKHYLGEMQGFALARVYQEMSISEFWDDYNG